MESLSPFLWRTCTSYNMPVYPGARWMVANPDIKTPMRLLITRITALNARLMRTSRQKGLCPPAAGAHRKALNSGLLSMSMRLAYISLGCGLYGQNRIFGGLHIIKRRPFRSRFGVLGSTSRERNTFYDE